MNLNQAVVVAATCAIAMMNNHTDKFITVYSWLVIYLRGRCAFKLVPIEGKILILV
jgi:hypothetical protein